MPVGINSCEARFVVSMPIEEINASTNIITAVMLILMGIDVVATGYAKKWDPLVCKPALKHRN